ncbi:MAG: nickel pincer cofactor biosynthesis protein LarC, partial [Desulfobacterota bacterium]|nr:nickel pincer cofactor biosynthesis protein LarC [Thermodesulfobacteriota bacterium]
RKAIEEVHFHEIGATDTIIDIVGTVVGIYHLNIDKIIASPLPLGRGFVHCNHGTIPLPAPATLEILREIPVYGNCSVAETVTPTGAAIIATLAQSFGPIPLLKIEKIGYGVGKREDQGIPNLLRIILGNPEKNFHKESLVVIETNIDDLNPEFYDYVFESLFAQGALDVLLVPVQMKKNRPGVILKVIANESNKSDLIRTMFRETTTLGVRVNTVERFQLFRKTELVETPWGKVRVKLIEGVNGNLEAYPEYEDCKKIAREKNISLKQVFTQISRLANP